MDLVPTSNANYIFLNNTEEDFEHPEEFKKKRLGFSPIGNMSATYYKVKANGEFTKAYLFGKPDKQNKNKFCNFTASDFDEETGVYTTLMIQDTKGKKVKLVWFNLER